MVKLRASWYPSVNVMSVRGRDSSNGMHPVRWWRPVIVEKRRSHARHLLKDRVLAETAVGEEQLPMPDRDN